MAKIDGVGKGRGEWKMGESTIMSKGWENLEIVFNRSKQLRKKWLTVSGKSEETLVGKMQNSSDGSGLYSSCGKDGKEAA